VARIVIHHSLAARQGTDDAVRFVRKVLREIRYIARLRVASGPYTTGALARSLEARGPFPGPGRVSGSVGSKLSYASAVEKGARRHLIFPIPPRKYMKFYWRKVGRVVYFDKVRHPGMQGKGYLAEAARTVGRRYNLRVIIYP
jgi:hypothetical protein